MKISSLLALLAAACMLALAALTPSCDAHAFMTIPLSRTRALGHLEWEAAGGNGIGTPVNKDNFDRADPCGDPHQDVGQLNIVNRPTDPVAVYSVGGIVSMTVKVNAQHGGWFGVKVCNMRTGFTQSCFDQFPLTNVDTGFQRWWMQTSAAGSMYTTNWRLPTGFSCDNGCVLQMTYRTANSCVDSCTAKECGALYNQQRNPMTGTGPLSICSSTARTEVFRDCADVKITRGSSGGTSAPTPSGSGGSGPVTPTPRPVVSTPSPGSGSNTGCNQAGWTDSQRAACFCTGKAPKMFADKSKSCAGFFNCYPGGSAYFACPANTIFNEQGGYCDWPSNVNCAASTGK